jgi:hypothetical protein
MYLGTVYPGPDSKNVSGPLVAAPSVTPVDLIVEPLVDHQ